MLNVGPYTLENPVILAPMAGLTDFPFRELCREFGAGLAIGEMTASDPNLWNTPKSATRWVCEGESGFRVVQLVGSDPELMAGAAQYAQACGADWIDINLGCPARKVLKKACGSALMREPDTVRAILRAVREAITVPVTLKMRTGWSAQEKNAVDIARLAQDEGVALLTVHGRTREQGFKGEVDYDTIRAVKKAVSIPVVANGDITSPEKAQAVLAHTEADGVMVGRAALGQPWLFQQIRELQAGCPVTRFSASEKVRVSWRHAKKHFTFYSGERGVRLFRKHLIYYYRDEPEVLTHLMPMTEATQVVAYLGSLAHTKELS